MTFASKFLKLLPSSIEKPDMGIEPDGDVVFDWYRSVNHVVSVSVSSKGRIAYAALLNGSEIKGSGFLNEQIPSFLLELLTAFTNQ